MRNLATTTTMQRPMRRKTAKGRPTTKIKFTYFTDTMIIMINFIVVVLELFSIAGMQFRLALKQEDLSYVVFAFQLTLFFVDSITILQLISLGFRVGLQTSPEW